MIVPDSPVAALSSLAILSAASVAAFSKAFVTGRSSSRRMSASSEACLEGDILSSSARATDGRTSRGKCMGNVSFLKCERRQMMI